MKAIGYLKSQDINDTESLVDISIPKPVPLEHDLLVKINAISVNPVDIKIRKNVEPTNNQHKILGWDAVGEVVGIGSDVTSFKEGDIVWYAGDLGRSGTNAEYHIVDERIVGLKPKSLTNAEAAAIPLTAITAWELLFDRLGFKENSTSKEHTKEQILIVGAAGGVGSILVQLAKQLTKATIIATASRPESKRWVTQLGADHVIDHNNSLIDELTAIGFDSVTHIISLTHTDEYFDSYVEIIAPQGKLALIDDPSAIDIVKLKRKSISLHWEFMFTRSMFTTDDMSKQGELLNTLSKLIDNGVIKTTLGENFGKINANNLKLAHASIDTDNTIGKVVLENF